MINLFVITKFVWHIIIAISTVVILCAVIASFVKLIRKIFVDEYNKIDKALIEDKKRKLNLCHTCIKSITTCDGHPKFGEGIGFDNVYECDSYIEKFK